MKLPTVSTVVLASAVVLLLGSLARNAILAKSMASDLSRRANIKIYFPFMGYPQCDFAFMEIDEGNTKEDIVTAVEIIGKHQHVKTLNVEIRTKALLEIMCEESASLRGSGNTKVVLVLKPREGERVIMKCDELHNPDL